MKSVSPTLMFRWDCPHCGKKHLIRSVPMELTPEECLESGIPLGSRGDVGGLRGVQRCRQCNAKVRME